MSDKRILIVEDDAIVAMTIEDSLHEMGYSVVGRAANANDAIKIAEDEKPDLILMDIRIQGDRDGIEAASEISRAYNIPIIYLTAYADKELLDRAKQTEPYGYIIKPYDERDLQSVIEMARYKYIVDKKHLEAEEKYRALTENTPDILFSTGMTGIITYVSPQINKYGFLEDEILGKTR